MSSSKEDGLTLTILGCGTLGTAILSGILDSLQKASSSSTSSDTPDTPARLPTRFVACVKRPESAKRITDSLSAHKSVLKVLHNDNLSGVKAADVVILGCKPYMVADLLGGEHRASMAEALSGKLLISILAGVTAEQIENELFGAKGSRSCRVVRALPNTASVIGESMTMIASASPPLSSADAALVRWIFSRIGRVNELPAKTMDAGTALCGSGPAFCALVIEALADGAVAMGVPRADAQFMAAQAMKGAAGLVLAGEHPAVVKDKISSPGGCTIGGLLVLEEGGVRGSVAKAVREATVVASQLGSGVQNVNGTRF
ncbi:MAG: Pyrroline-5-carboxylate reductase [Sarcosagium campestre]|nr:MAG: Pyrroline-5-carboxylate reductase [Sarcosagium campestre]